MAVVRSVLSGRRLARAISQHYADGVAPLSRLAVEADSVLNIHEVEGIEAIPRRNAPLPTAEAGTTNDWRTDVEIPGLNESAAREEADRCLRCGLICYKKAV